MRRLVILSALALLGFATVVWGQPQRIERIVREPPAVTHFLCGREGGTCCRPPSGSTASPEMGPLIHCNQGLGCDISINTCVSPCGSAGQVCCDGPETRAPKWTDDGRVYVPAGRNVREMCQGSVCDPATRRCVDNCGMKAGDPCCGPQPGIGVASCLNPSLACQFPEGSQWERGTCQPCGKLGQMACTRGESCSDNLVEQDGVCVACGLPGQPTCDRGEPCRLETTVPHPITGATCVEAGGRNQPCMRDGRCGYQDLMCNARNFCEGCGMAGQACCPGQTCWEGLCLNDICVSCGQEGLPVCPFGEPCSRPGEPINGYCRPCGGEGQGCCYSLSIRCDAGLSCKDRTCRRPNESGGQQDNPRTCSGQPYAWSTIPRTIYVDDENGCTAPIPYLASTPAEAEQCARAQFGENVIGPVVSRFTVWLSCPYSGCITRYYPARDLESAKSCAASQEEESCEVVESSCP